MDPITPISFTTPAASTTSTSVPDAGVTLAPPPDGGSSSSGTASDLYLYAFMATLVLLVGAFFVIFGRSALVRRRNMRIVERALGAGTFPPNMLGFDAARFGVGVGVGARDAEVVAAFAAMGIAPERVLGPRPAMCEVCAREKGGGGFERESAWAGMMPLSAAISGPSPPVLGLADSPSPLPTGPAAHTRPRSRFFGPGVRSSYWSLLHPYELDPSLPLHPAYAPSPPPPPRPIFPPANRAPGAPAGPDPTIPLTVLIALPVSPAERARARAVPAAEREVPDVVLGVARPVLGRAVAGAGRGDAGSVSDGGSTLAGGDGDGDRKGKEGEGKEGAEPEGEAGGEEEGGSRPQSVA